MKFRWLLLSALISLEAYAQNQGPQSWREQLSSGATLSSVQRIFLGESVVVDGEVVDLIGSVLLQWQVASKDGEHYIVPDSLNHLLAKYRKNTATVVAVQLAKSRDNVEKTNALGETISNSGQVNQRIEFVVTFADGTIAMASTYPILLDRIIALESTVKELSALMSKQLPLLIGKMVYAVRDTPLYSPDTTLAELTAQEVSKRLWPTDCPLLAPLQITSAKYVDSTGVVLKLKLPNGHDALSFTSQSDYELVSARNEPFFKNVAGDLLTEFPRFLSLKDIDAIKSRSIYKGMGRLSLEYALGSPEKENDWGRGGKQLIYRNSRFIYLDSDEKVVDWQRLDAGGR